MYTQASNKATQKYISKAYDSVFVRVPKGQKKKLQEYCKIHDLSMNQLICDLLERETNIKLHK